MIKVKIEETVSYEIGRYTTVTDIITFENEDDLKEYLLDYQFHNGDYLDEEDINELLKKGYNEVEYLKVTLKILERN